MQYKKNPFLRLLNISVLCLWCVESGCQMPVAQEADAPTWFTSPIQEDSDNFYFVSRGSSPVGLEEARQVAMDAVKKQISERICTKVQIERGDGVNSQRFESGAELRDVGIRDESHARYRSGWVVWVLCRYPKQEYNKAVDKINRGYALKALWNEARSLADRGQAEAAESKFLEILAQYDMASRMDFQREEVKLELARLSITKGPLIKARQWLSDIANSTADQKVKQTAADMFKKLPQPTARDAFFGKTVGVCGFLRKDGVTSSDVALAQEIKTRLIRESVSVAPTPAGLTVENDEIIDSAVAVKIARAFATNGSDAVLAATLEIDSSKTGKKINIPLSDAEMPVLDATMRYIVIRVPDGKILASGSTPGYSYNIPHLLTVVMTHRSHLPNAACMIADGLAEQIPAK